MSLTTPTHFNEATLRTTLLIRLPLLCTPMILDIGNDRMVCASGSLWLVQGLCKLVVGT